MGRAKESAFSFLHKTEKQKEEKKRKKKAKPQELERQEDRRLACTQSCWKTCVASQPWVARTQRGSVFAENKQASKKKQATKKSVLLTFESLLRKLMLLEKDPFKEAVNACNSEDFEKAEKEKSRGHM